MQSILSSARSVSLRPGEAPPKEISNVRCGILLEEFGTLVSGCVIGANGRSRRDEERYLDRITLRVGQIGEVTWAVMTNLAAEVVGC
jgi:hypothetical protein